jgi:hypothetical protein
VPITLVSSPVQCPLSPFPNANPRTLGISGQICDPTNTNDDNKNNESDFWISHPASILTFFPLGGCGEDLDSGVDEIEIEIEIEIEPISWLRTFD